ncbi:Signal transduction response regulator, receiver region domain protein [Rhodopirellula europaea SH398]|jgi:two-component system response regulator AtoC|uniref:Signal transduction response regulator, receiver region domain protein n=3 Tax=Pirellulaceae TaxID=2691357 RepID=M5SAX1_9BACT|nr:protein containing Signal transduction response regulator, receiver region domain protein [Rhodopirellula europaea 6C]EMI28778.1 Signal transduction response regulator, receiver region domain protein [Rhodopirellula europaea SH398]|tara:strand:- start:5279 stop:5686 length:408 start_codon:yes stop_codon:yes gene_type:complete
MIAKNMNAPEKKRVLIAEDDPVLRHLLQFTLDRAGMDVTAVANGQLAWDEIQSGQKFDVLVTDHEMPELSGVDLIGRVVETTSISVIVLCTAKGFEIDPDRIVDRPGLVSLVSKPFSPKQLVSIIEERLKKNAAD